MVFIQIERDLFGLNIVLNNKRKSSINKRVKSITIIMTHEIHIEWIKNYLIPNLINNQKLLPNKSPLNKQIHELKMYDIKLMSHQVAFMLTFCYYVKIVLKVRQQNGEAAAIAYVNGNHELNEANDEKKDEITFDIVVKVSGVDKMWCATRCFIFISYSYTSYSYIYISIN